MTQPQFHDPQQTPPPFPNTPGGYGAQGYTGVPTPHGPAGQSVPSADERTLAMLAHLSAPIAAVISAGWLNIVGPLVVWLIFKDRSPFVRNAAAGSFNFTISMWLMSVVGWILVISVIGMPIGLILLFVSALGAIVLGVIGALRTFRGLTYTYPWQFRVLS